MIKYISIIDNDGNISFNEHNTKEERDTHLLAVMRTEMWFDDMGVMPDNADEAYQVWLDYWPDGSFIIYEHEVEVVTDEEKLILMEQWRYAIIPADMTNYIGEKSLQEHLYSHGGDFIAYTYDDPSGWKISGAYTSVLNECYQRCLDYDK